MQKLSFLLIPIFLIIFIQFFISQAKLLKFPAEDFQVFYNAGQISLTGENPYEIRPDKNPFKNPPPTLFIFAPLSILPILKAQTIWFFISLVSFLIGSFYLLEILAWNNWKVWLLYLSAALLFFPLRYNLGSGQLNCLLFLTLSLTFYYLNKNSMRGIFSLSSGIILKVTPLFLFLPLVLQKKFKIILFTIFSLILLNSLAFLVFGTKVYKGYIAAGQNYFDLSVNFYYNQSLFGFLNRQFQRPEINVFVGIPILILSLIYFIYLMKIFKKNPFFNLTFFNLSILYMLIFSPYSIQYHFTIAIFPLITTLYLGLKQNLPKIFFLLLGVSYLLMAINFKNSPANFISSHVLFGAVLLLILNFFL